MSVRKEIISSWEKDPNQWFTESELQILRESGCIKSEVQKIL